MNKEIVQSLRGCWIEAECKPGRCPSFEADYQSVTGQKPLLGDSYRTQDKKNGLQLSCYFNGTPKAVAAIQKLGFNVQDNWGHYMRNRYTHRVRTNAFVMKVFSQGFRLGQN